MLLDTGVLSAYVASFLITTNSRVTFLADDTLAAGNATYLTARQPCGRM